MSAPVKKVLFTSHVANFQKFNRPFMRMLSDHGYEVHYASMGEEKILDCDQEFVVPFTRSPFRLISNYRAYRQLKQIIDREKYDIIHTHTPMGSVVTRLAARSARKRGTRVIYTAHGFHFFTGAPLLNWLIYYPVERYMARHTDTLITINNEDYRRAKSQFKTDVQYVPGVGIDPKKFDIKMTKAEKSQLRKSLGLKDSDFVMIYVAELSKRKNQMWLANTLAKFIRDNPDVHLLLPGKDSLCGKLHNLVDKLGLQGRVCMLGYRQDIPQLMKISDLAVSSARQEGLPVNIMEAMYLGLPIVATDCRGNRDLLEDYSTGRVIAQKDSTRFIEAVTWVRAATVDWQEAIKTYRLDEVIKRMATIYATE